jgi:hypothetical protein
MDEALRFFRTYEVWIYLLLGLGGLIYLRKFILAWQELRGAGFGLERDSAQARLNQSASALVLLFTLVIIEFVLVSFIAPTMPGATPLLTPTLDLLATSTITLPASTPGTALATAPLGTAPAGTVEPAGLGLSAATGLPADALAGTPAAVPAATLGPGTPLAGGGCLPGQVFIAHPLEGTEINGTVPITGTVDIPNFGFYKFEMRPQGGSDTSWLTILAGNEARQDANLGSWNTTLLPPGNYELGLVVTDNQGKSLPACVVNVRIAPPQTPQS